MNNLGFSTDLSAGARTSPYATMIPYGFLVRENQAERDPVRLISSSSKAPNIPPSACEYRPKNVAGLSSACEEEGVAPDIHPPEPKVATDKLEGDETRTLKGDATEDTSVKMEEDKVLDEPGEQMVQGAADFSDFFENWNGFMKNYFTTKTAQKRKSTNKKKADDEIPKNRQRMSASKIKAK